MNNINIQYFIQHKFRSLTKRVKKDRDGSIFFENKFFFLINSVESITKIMVVVRIII